MGQRGSKAAFMPNKFVFPGGAVDADDSSIPLAKPLVQTCHARLLEDSSGPSPETLAVAAIRELWEETGLILGAARGVAGCAKRLERLCQGGLSPLSRENVFLFSRHHPTRSPRRFDARFFLVDADQLAGDLDDFSGASDELSHLQWVPLDEARALNLPFITSIVLGELAALREIQPPASVPFFKNQDEESLFLRLHGSEQQEQ